MMNARLGWSFLAIPVLATIGCSSAVPLPNRGALILSINGAMCPEPAKTYEVAGPADTMPNNVVIDGQSGAAVSCSVTGNGPYTFSGSFHGLTSDGFPVTVSFTDGQVGADKMSGTATVDVLTTDLGSTSAFASAAGACDIEVINSQIKPGSIWATFSCAAVSLPPENVCQVAATSTIVFEDCQGS
jgi:hypothetical protein